MLEVKSMKRTQRPQCGLCGKSGKLTRTDCCANWICNDERNYALFSYAQNSCHRDHRRLTLCGSHHAEGHKGDWKDCKECRVGFKPEMIAWYGANRHNFEKLPNPPSFKPTKCTKCKTVLKFGTDGYTQHGGKFWCRACVPFGPIRP